MTYCEIDGRVYQLCEKCASQDGWQAFPKKSDVLEWIAWKLKDDSWAKWRLENREAVEEMEKP